ncbi:hypothetical protein KJ840_00115 [Patescibacteria group bacterium]|nr:hypothetical protein [Patescibacteria group bacterium]
MASQSKNKKIWLVTVDMGYGHQRATYPLKHLAYRGLISANNYQGIPSKDRKVWHEQRKFYEAVCRFKKVPLVGNLAFEVFDLFQRIPEFYPKRDLSGKSIQVISSFRLIKEKSLGEHLINLLKKRPQYPLLTSFFLTAFMAEIFNYPGEIYCIICDADISRAWVSALPKNSKIKYFAPCQRVVERLKLYGVAEDRIFLTGFPLPKENIGSERLPVLKQDLKNRLVNLDPQRLYLSKYKDTLCKNLSIKNFPKKANHPLTITFAVGGAGAQREIGAQIIKGLSQVIIKKQIRINLIAGVHRDVNKYFKEQIQKLKLQSHLNKEIRILFTQSKMEYFQKFNEWLRTTDILWTKPSELSFYSGLGLPIVMSPPIGSQEDFNRKYLINLGAGLDQEDLKYVDEWLFDWINSGRLAEAAAQGFLEAPKLGTFNIEKILTKRTIKTRGVKTISPY